MRSPMNALTAFLLVLCSWSQAHAEVLATSVDSIGLSVTDLDRSVAFYRDVLTFTEESRAEVAGDDYEHLFGVFGLRLRTARLRLGDEHVELMQFVAPSGRPVPADSRSNDRWFQHVAIIVRDMKSAYARLRERNVTHASPGPQKLPDWNPNAGGIEAFYFRDPDGNHLEILAFPAGKGSPKWHRPGKDLFIGVDHTAIVVADTDESLRFYRDALGLTVAGESENYGPEQEWLNNVFGARLRITTLRAPAGPGIELLEYLTPRDGRPGPADARSNDVFHWQVRLVVPDAAAALAAVRRARGSTVTPAAAEVPEGRLGLRRGALVRDPDGHAVQLAEP